MDDKFCRITVVGARRRVDLAVPAGTAIAEYLPDLVRRCGQLGDDTLPPAWSLALAGEKPFSPSLSLLEAQVVDGATLYLRDLVAGENDGPLITDLEEAVVEESGRWERWSSWHGALSAAVLGLLGYLAALVSMVMTAPDNPLAGLLALLSGFSLVLVAGLAARKDWPVPPRLRTGLALAAVPALALAGYALPVSRAGENAAAVAAVSGATVAALAVLLAVVNVWTLAVALLSAVALPVAVLLALLDADRTERAAAVAVVMLILLSIGPTAAGRLASLSPGRGGLPGSGISEEATAALARSRRLLVVWAVTGSAGLVCCLVTLSGASDPYALSLVACVGLALLAQAGQTMVPSAVFPVLAAGIAGLVALGVRAPGVAWLPEVSWMLIVSCVCLLMSVVGLVKLVDPADDAVERPAWIRSVASTLSVLSVPLAVGVFGVYEALADIGARL